MSRKTTNWMPRVLGLALIVLAIALVLFLSGFGRQDLQNNLLTWNNGICWTLAWVIFAAGIFSLLSSWDTRGGSWIRLDWFLPMVRKQDSREFQAPSLLAKFLRKVLPAQLQSNWETKKRGLIRRNLRRLGPSWLASPVRRLVQGLCLISFGVLFFYTCWPYDAVPFDNRVLSTGWKFIGFDQSSNLFQFTAVKSDSGLSAGGTVYLVAEATAPFAPDDGGLLGEFQVHSVEQIGASADSGGKLDLSPAGELTSAMMNLVLGDSQHTYAVYERSPSAWPSHYADNLASKEWIPAETFLMIDPLVSLSTALASRSWVWSLASAASILIVCLLIPRGFCGYLCPLGTTIDIFDWAVAGRTKRFRVPNEGWWVHIKYYLLAGILTAACFGVLVSGFFSAIPVITRGMLFLFDPLQNGLARGWHLVPNPNLGQFISIAMFFGVLGLGFLRPRFWCKYVCPSGAVFSIGNLFRASERKVESSCIHCNKCVEVCPFDAIKPDFTTRVTDCTLCQTCGGVCPTHAIKFVERGNVVELKLADDPPTGESALGRRGFLSLAAGSAAAIAGGTAVALGTKSFGAKLSNPLPTLLGDPEEDAYLPVRPPGSVPEQEFLEMCIRCGECFKACPNNVLQPEGFQQGLEGLWTPLVNADWAGCESSCNACGQVCPTGAIRALPLEEKRVARMGLAIVNESTCLPFAGKEACDLCVQECNAAGYHAIEYTQVGVEVDDQGQPVDGTGFAAPVVLAERCVGCGLCQTRCNVINVKDRHALTESAIIVQAGGGREDRMMSGSYLELRSNSQAPQQPFEYPSDLPPRQQSPVFDDPFGVESAGAQDTTITDATEESPF